MRHNRPHYGLLQLLADNRRTFTPVEQRILRASAAPAEDAPTTATVYLYDPIVGDRMTAEWWGGICPQDLVPALHALDVQQIDLRINCPGGDVFGAEAICEALREHPANVIAHIEGLAASAATAITCACDEVLITPASKFMIHEAWTMAIGNKRDMAACQAILATVDESLIAEYARRTGQTVEQLVAWVEAETWFNAADAVKYGFADAVKEPAKAAAASAHARAAWKLSAFKHAPKDEPAEPVQTSAPPDPAAVAAAAAAQAAIEAAINHRARQQQRLALAARTQIV